MSITIVRYRPKPDRAAENQRLIEEVFSELNQTRPDGLRYAAFRLDDGTFLHVAEIGTDSNPLASSPAFARFTEGIADRCEAGEGPNPRGALLVGSYELMNETN